MRNRREIDRAAWRDAGGDRRQRIGFGSRSPWETDENEADAPTGAARAPTGEATRTPLWVQAASLSDLSNKPGRCGGPKERQHPASYRLKQAARRHNRRLSDWFDLLQVRAAVLR